MIAALASIAGTRRQLGNYRLGRVIGSGGMASVFVADQQTNVGASRLVALKILHLNAGADAMWRVDFRREAELATRLEHPSIIRTYDVGEVDGCLYLAMELVHGAPLSVVQSATEPALAATLVTRVARALHFAHDLCGRGGEPLGMVHQDVTPHNVMVGYDGRVRLLDFGVARLAAIDGSRTDTVRGKPAYLAPEQIEGGKLDRRVDVFALGVMLHELLTGHRLFLRDTVAATYKAILIDPVPDVRELRPTVPAALADVVRVALRRDPSARWQSAAALADALAELHQAAGLGAVEEAAIGAWIREVAPPTFTLSDLEREIADLALADRVARADEPTARERSPYAAPIAQDSRTRPRSAPGIARVEARRAVPARRVALTAFGMLVATGAMRVAWTSLHREAAPPVATEPGPRAPEPSSPPPGALPLVPVLSPSSIAEAQPSPTPRRTHHTPPASLSPKTPVLPSSTAASPAVPTVAAASPAGGWLDVWSNVWGHVDIDGHPAGDSPLARVAAAAGPHVVHIVTQRGEQSDTVTVVPGEETRKRFTF